MTYEQGLRWLAAIGGTHDVVREGTREVVVVRVSSASKGEVCARTTLDTSMSQSHPRAAMRGASLHRAAGGHPTPANARGQARRVTDAAHVATCVRRAPELTGTRNQ
jgi:hypothetical protein